jgi:glyoxylase-like metal-dependent hydrolase (beta-lactamase superfamily II)
LRPFPEVDNVCAIAIDLPGYSDLITANVYAVGSGPVTLIDTAPKFPGSFEILKDQLARGGFALADVERIVFTHGHVDHFGLAARIREEVGRPIPCFIHAEERWRVTAESYREEMFNEAGERLMAMVDMPPEEVAKIRERFSVFTLLCDPVFDAKAMEDGDVFEGEGCRLEVIHTPGHTPGTCCLYETRQKILFSGDHIIKHITPNPLFEMKKEILRDPGYQSLKAYIRSLEKVKGIDARYVFPGHGEFIEDLPGLIASYRGHHSERMERIWKALKKGSRPLYHIVDEVFDFVPEYDGFLAISEILVHLGLLIEEGRAELADPGPPAYYRAIG